MPHLLSCPGAPHAHLLNAKLLSLLITASYQVVSAFRPLLLASLFILSPIYKVPTTYPAWDHLGRFVLWAKGASEQQSCTDSDMKAFLVGLGARTEPTTMGFILWYLDILASSTRQQGMRFKKKKIGRKRPNHHVWMKI